MAYQQEVINNYDREYNGPNNYVGGGWAPNEPITSDKMNNIEAGIVEAIKLSNKNTSDMTDISSRLTLAETNASNANSQALKAYNNLDAQLDNIANGSNAWNSIKVFLNATSNSGSAINEGMAARRDLISAMSAMLTEAAGTYTVNNLPSLPARLEAMTTSLNNATSSLQGLQAEINNAKQTPNGVDTAGYHLVDNINVIKNAIAALKGEIEGAHRQVGDTLLQRFTDLNTRLDSIDDANPAEGTTLASRLAAVESELGQLDNSYIDQIMAELDAAHRKNITGLDSLNRRFEEIESAVSTNTSDISGLETKVTAIETELNDARIQIGEDESTNEPIMSTLDLRLDSFDTAIDAISGANGTVPELLTQMEALIGLNGTISNLTTRIGALETEVDMTSASSRIDLLSNEITEAHRTLANNEQDTLKKRFDAMDTRMTNIENGNIGDATSTIVIDNATFDENDKPILPNDESPNTSVDYLIKKEDKYYYWKYIDNNWELISGGGGNGSGNSNAEDYATRAAFNAAEKELNKDYYVLESDGIRHHYRYLDTTNESEPIEIGIPSDLIKNYQIATSTERNNNGEDDKYLDLYKFNINQNIDTNEIEDNLDTYSQYRIAHVLLPKGGGGESDSSAARIYARVLGDSIRRISYSEAKTNGITLKFAYTCYSRDGEIYDYTHCTYTLTREDGKVIASTTTPVTALSVNEYQDLTKFNITIPNIEQECNINVPTTFTLTIHNPNDANVRDRNVPVYITVIDLQLSSTFSDNRTYPTSSALLIPYTFVGLSDLDVNFTVLLDNALIDAQNSNNNITIRANLLSNQSGVHDLVITAHQTLSGIELSSNSLHYLIGLVSGTDDEIMLFSGASLSEQEVEQYKILKIPYYLYIPNNGSELVEYKVWELNYNSLHEYTGRIEISELERPAGNASTGAYEYPFRVLTMDIETQYYQLVISCADKTLTFNIKVSIADEQINIRTDNLVFDFKPERYSNNVTNEEDRLWSYTNGNTIYKMRIPEGAHFDWRTGGWMNDDNEVPCFCVKAGSRVEFVQEENNVTSPLTLFWHDMEILGGSDFKCTFKIDNVKTPNTPFLTSLDKETNVITNYGKTILSSKLDIEVEDTLLHNYINTQYIFIETINSKNKVIKEAIGTTVLDNAPFYEQLTEEKRAAAVVDARESNKKKIKKYIGNIYDIARQASIDELRDYLLRVLSGKSNEEAIDYSTIKNDITNYLFDSELYDAGTASNTNALAVYNRLTAESNDSTTITYAYRQVEPINFDALLNGFIVEGKDGKDGIIAMILFRFQATIKSKSKLTFTQTVSELPISTNSFTKTAIFKVTTTEILTEELQELNVLPEVKIYEVTMSDPSLNGTYTEIVSIRDASNTETRAYGLELNALGSNIYLPSGAVTYAHSEGDTIEFEYNIHPAIENHVNSSIIIYEDGVPSAAKLYNTGNNIFEQANPGCLTIGSDECDVYIYKMRLYDQSISNEDILSNFYADGLTPDDMIARYERNKTLVAHMNDLTPQIVANECPDLRVIMIEAPNLTGGKTSFIKNTKIRLIYKNGRPEDNWVALNAYHAGQGTSSDNYGVAGRNLDIIFGFDGVDTVIIPKPQKNNYTFDPSYKSILIKGLDADLTNDIKTAEEYEEDGYTVEYNGTGKVSFTEDSIPNNWFNIKVNIASSENTNNAYLQKRFDRYLPYDTPAKKRDDKIKNDMEFFNCVIFIKETGTASEFTEDNSIAAADRPWHFYGIGNIGDSKKTDKTRVNVPGDPKEFCIEISDNGLVLSGFSSGVFYISEASKNRSKAIESPYKLDELNARIDELTLEYNDANTSSADKTRIQEEITTLRGYTVMATALSATTFRALTSEEYSINNDNYTIQVGVPDALTMYGVPIITEVFTYYRCFMFINSVWTEVGEPITFTRTEYGIKYPVSEAEWTSDKNTYYSTLYDINSGKGWDKSYEFRYDLTTKDGETVARNDTEAALNKLRQNFNKTRFADMYSWLVTSSNEGYKATISDWFIKESPLYWYLFTERYTMIDSRAKNTFYHCGKVYITEDEAAGTNIPALEAAVETALNEIELENAQSELAVAEFLRDNAEYFTIDNVLADSNHNNGYRFELWDYDNDTSLGINNNGLMVFSAGLEDIDKDISGWIYNEAESVMWRRIRENMYDDLSALYVRLKGECFNAENLIIEFDNMLNQFPEELWRLDFERKYYRPFEKKNETTYLNDMANGRKKYQRRQFERNMAIYINSKYQRNGSYDPTDIISFRPLFTWTAGRNTTIIIKPYSTMYINFMLGNNDPTRGDTVVSTRVNRGEPYTINASEYIHDFNNIQCTIYNASRIMALDGLGNFECKQFSLGAAKKLSVLKLGSTDYTNKSMEDVNNMGLSAGLPLLEELDLTNIEFTNPPDTFALENFPLLKKINATGCNIRSFTFKDGGMLESIIFPAVLTKIDFKNLYNLIDTVDDLENLVRAVQLTGAANLTSYNSVNSYSNSYQIVENMLANAGKSNNITSLKLNDINWSIGDISSLEPLEELQDLLGTNMELEGRIEITGEWSEPELDHYVKVFKKVTFVTNGILVEKHLITYINEDHTELWRTYQSPGDPIIDPVYDINPETNSPYIDIPICASTAEYDYYFGQFTNEGDDPDRPESYYIRCSGWRNTETEQMLNDDAVVGNDDIEFIAVYPRREARAYPVKWYDYDRETVITSTNVRYGNIIPNNAWPTTFTKAKRITTNSGTKYVVFNGWDSPSVKISGETSIYSLWEESPLITQFTNDIRFDNLTAANLYAIASINSGTLRDNLLSDYLGDDTFDITMGYDPTYNVNGLVETNLLTAAGSSQELYLTGNRSNVKVISDLKPLLNLDLSWTLAIDFKFLLDNSTWYGSSSPEFVLISCFNETGSTMAGFRVSLVRDNLNSTSTGNNVAVKVIWGKESTTTPALTIDKAIVKAEKDTSNVPLDDNVFNTYRNMVVLRHDGAYPNRLYVYTQSNMTEPQYYNTLNESITETTLTYSGSLQVTNPIIIGGNYQLDTTTIEQNQNTRRPAKAMIYYAKYWNMDLGVRECRMLAAWPHETVKFRIQGYAEGQDLDSSTKLLFGSEVYPAKINISAATPIGDRAYQATASTNDNTWKQEDELRTGWQYTMIRNYCSKMIFNAFPITYLSLITTVMMKSSEMVDSSTNRATSQISADTNVNLFEKIYLPSYQELYYNSNPQQAIDTRYSSEAAHSWPLMTPRNVRLLFNMVSSDLILVSDNTDIRPMRWAFPGRVMTERTRILMMEDNPLSVAQLTPLDSLYADRDGVIILRTGDVWWNTNDNTPYMYATSIEITRGAPVEPSLTVYDENTGAVLGGWIPAIRYGTRTYYMLAESTYNHNRRYSRNFLMVNNDGSVLDQTNAGTIPMTTRMIMPQFSI